MAENCHFYLSAIFLFRQLGQLRCVDYSNGQYALGGILQMAWDKELDPGSVAYAIATAPENRVRVLAGPGTGKSFAMKRRVAKLLEEGVAPNEILAMTFTRVAAEDLHRELQKLDTPGCDQLEGKTLHSLAMGILSRTHVLQYLGRKPRPLNKFEIRAMRCDLAATHGGVKKVKAFIQDYEAAWAQSQGDEPGYAKTKEEQAFQKDLVDWLVFHEAMLIGELIPYLVRFLKTNPAAPEHNEFKHLLIDEYQDLNKAEQTAIEYLGASANVCIVGDDDQSIYSFKRAHPDGIREWKDVNEGCGDLAMADCHRCPTDVVEMANALIGHNQNREERVLTPLPVKGKGEVLIMQLPSIEKEAELIADYVSELLKGGVHPSEIIVLVQRRGYGKSIMEALKKAEVPAKSYYDESQLETEAAQKRFALLKLLLDREDRVALRYLLGAGSADFRSGAYSRLRDHCETTGDSHWKAMERVVTGELKLPQTGGLVAAFNAILGGLEELEAAKDDLAALVEILFPDGVDDLAEIRNLALAEIDGAESAADLFRSMMDEITQPDIPPTVEEVRLMSFHKSKGLSSPYVFMAGCVQGILPPLPEAGTPKAVADAQMEEARRLFYVGITRVKADPDKNRLGSLVITYPQQMGAGKAKQFKVKVVSRKWFNVNLQPSQFIEELGPAAPKPEVG
jgi:superfamily I DNA/RNA helicase